jgi:signal transduction histidine kinase
VTSRQFLSRWGDVLLAGGLAVAYLLEVLGESGFAGDRTVSVPAAVVFCASLAVRRRLPLAPLGLGLALIELSNLAAPALANAGTFTFGFVIAIYSAGAYSEGRAALAAALIVLAAIPLAAIEPGEASSAADWGFFLMFFGGPFVAGRVIRHRRGRERALEGRAVELAQESEERARAAVAEERIRIARELHDVVSHAVSVIVLQARGARRNLPDEDGRLREALDVIERSGTEALAEMRRLLNILRQHDEELALAPQPSLRRIGDLVQSVRSAGLPVELTVEGDIEDLPPGVDVSAYRIVQEALTNALKHAGPARALVAIRRLDGELEIEVLDTGPGASDGDGAGQGLVGMRERVAVYGGELEAGRRAEGGYALSARLPVEWAG